MSRAVVTLNHPWRTKQLDYVARRLLVDRLERHRAPGVACGPAGPTGHVVVEHPTWKPPRLAREVVVAIEAANRAAKERHSAFCAVNGPPFDHVLGWGE